MDLRKETLNKITHEAKERIQNAALNRLNKEIREGSEKGVLLIRMSELIYESARKGRFSITFTSTNLPELRANDSRNIFTLDACAATLDSLGLSIDWLVDSDNMQLSVSWE